MINSLSKDSHITQSLWHSQNYDSGNRKYKGMSTSVSNSPSMSERKEYSSATVNNSIGISVRKPAEISFCGLSDIELAKHDNFRNLISKAKTFLGSSKTQEKIKELFNESVEILTGNKKNAAENASTFVKDNKQSIQSMIDKARELLLDENKKKPLKSDILEKEVKKTIGSAVKVYHEMDKVIGQGPHSKSIYKNETLKKFFLKADKTQVLFQAGFALFLTCALRPLTIMALPSDKKNVDDKKYASAQSMASGILGFVLAFILSDPIAKAAKKIFDSKEDAPKKMVDYLGADGKAMKYLNSLGDDAKLAKGVMSNYLNQLPDIMMALPKAMITIALVPIILKHVFKLEKKKHSEAKNNQTVNQPQAALNVKEIQTKNSKATNISGGKN